MTGGGRALARRVVAPLVAGVAAALLPAALAAAPSAHASAPALRLPPLPRQVAAEARAAAGRALDDPDLVDRLVRAREATDRAGAPRFEWSASHGWRVAWDGTASFDASLSIEAPLFDPAGRRDARDAGLHLERVRLDATLHARSAAEELVRARIALWRSRSIAERLRRARSLLPTARGDAADRLRTLLDYEPTARFETERTEAAIARATTGEVPPPLATPRWTDASAPGDPACVEGDADVLRARADLRLAVEREEAERLRASPTVRAGVSASLRQAEVGSAPVDLGGRVWLQVGVPSAWQVAGTLRTEVDAYGTEARATLSGPDHGTSGGGGEVGRARRALERALYEAADDAAYRRHELARTEARLAVLEGAAVPAGTVDAVERDLEMLDLAAARASLRATMAFACAWAP